MKKYIYSILLYILIFSSVKGLFSGISISPDPVYWMIVMVGFAIAVSISMPLLKFMTIKRNFITTWFVSGIIVFGVVYAFDLLLPSFFVKESIFLGVESELVSVASFRINTVMTMLAYAFVSTAVCSLMDNLNKRGTDE